MKTDFDPDWDLYIKAAMGRKAFNPAVLDLRDLSSVADLFIIVSGRSNRQVTAIAEFIVSDLKKQGKHPLHVEGKKEGHWALLDYGHVVIHVFYEPVRNFYDLEGRSCVLRWVHRREPGFYSGRPSQAARSMEPC